MSLDEDITKILNENINLQDSNCLAEVLGDYFATSDDSKYRFIHQCCLHAKSLSVHNYR